MTGFDRQRLRVERMIAQGKAHPDDRFFYVSWRR
jgi:hypothetical protein